MAKEINDNTITDFINGHLNIEDFGYLVVPDDPVLNDEALSKIKQDFREFIDSDD